MVKNKHLGEMTDHRNQIRREKKVLNSKVTGMKAIMNKTMRLNYSSLTQFNKEHVLQMKDVINKYQVWSLKD